MPEYGPWREMRKRCLNPQAYRYPNYGGRGIRICERWDSFANFLADMGPRPSLRHSIERVDNDGNYEPSNCVWADQRTQCRNKRSTKLTQQDVDAMRTAHAQGVSYRSLAKQYGVTFAHVGQIVRREKWK